MYLLTLAANALLKELGLTPIQVEAMLAEADANWLRLVRAVEHLDSRTCFYIIGWDAKTSEPTQVQKHFQSDATSAAIEAAWVLANHMHKLYTGEIEGLDPELCAAEGSHARPMLEQLIRCALAVMKPNQDPAAREITIQDQGNALLALRDSPSLALVMDTVVLELAQADANPPQG